MERHGRYNEATRWSKRGGATTDRETMGGGTNDKTHEKNRHEDTLGSTNGEITTYQPFNSNFHAAPFLLLTTRVLFYALNHP